MASETSPCPMKAKLSPSSMKRAFTSSRSCMRMRTPSTCSTAPPSAEYCRRRVAVPSVPESRSVTSASLAGGTVALP